MNNIDNIKFVFFGTPEFSVVALEEMKRHDLIPSLVITAPDRKAGRGMKLTRSPVKIWAEENNIALLQPEKLDAEFISKIKMSKSDLFIVAAYGKIIPKTVLDIPAHGTLNLHPSLLPKFRGASPLQSFILSNEKETGVTIMLMDEKMDHGEILASKKLTVKDMNTEELGNMLFYEGGKMLFDIIPKWITGEIKSTPQDHAQATYTEKIKKEHGLIDQLSNDAENWRKFLAFYPWPGVYFFKDMPDGKKKRIKITGAEFTNNTFMIKKIIPEGGKEADYTK